MARRSNPYGARGHFHVEADGSFSLDAAWLRAARTA